MGSMPTSHTSSSVRWTTTRDRDRRRPAHCPRRNGDTRLCCTRARICGASRLRRPSPRALPSSSLRRLQRASRCHSPQRTGTTPMGTRHCRVRQPRILPPSSLHPSSNRSQTPTSKPSPNRMWGPTRSSSESMPFSANGSRQTTTRTSHPLRTRP